MAIAHCLLPIFWNSREGEEFTRGDNFDADSRRLKMITRDLNQRKSASKRESVVARGGGFLHIFADFSVRGIL